VVVSVLDNQYIGVNPGGRYLPDFGLGSRRDRGSP